MNNLLFTALIIALLYYFFYYLPSQKKLTNPPLTQSQFTQTEPDPITINKESPSTVDFPSAQFVPDPQEIKKLEAEKQALEKDYQQKVKDQQTQITNLQAQIRDLVKRPLKPTNSKSIQTDEEKDLTNTLDTLIKNIQALNNEL
jgi:hypothetical protein